MAEQGLDTSLFTHRCVVSTPEGFGPETSASIDRYVLTQISRRWRGAFARVDSGVYLLDVKEDSASDAYALMVMLAVSLFGRLSTPAVRLEEIGAESEGGDEDLSIDSSGAERLLRTLAGFSQQEIVQTEANEASDAGSLGAIEAAVREAQERIGAIGGDVGQITAQIAGVQDGVAQISERVAALQTAPQPAAVGGDENKPLFNIAKSGAVGFAATLKGMSRQVEAAVAALSDAVQRIDAAAPSEAVEAVGGSKAPSEETMRSLAENLAELGRGQARIAEALEGRDAAPAAASAEEPRVEGADNPLLARIAELSEKAEANQAASEALTKRLDDVRADAPAAVAEMLGQMAGLAQESRDSANLMLDVSVAWSRASEGSSAAAAGAGEPSVEEAALETPAVEEAVEEIAADDVSSESVMFEEAPVDATAAPVEDHAAAADAAVLFEGAEDQDAFGEAIAGEEGEVQETA